MVAGALIGAAFGYLLGQAIVFEWAGTRIPMNFIVAALGSIIGLTLVRVFAGGKKAPAHAAVGPKADKAKAKKK